MNGNRTILDNFFAQVIAFTERSDSDLQKVIAYKSPEELQELIDFRIGEDGVGYETLFLHIAQYLEHATHTHNPQFFNQLFGGFNLPAFMGEVITALTNTSMATFEIAPVASLIETEMIQKMCGIVGYTQGDGIFVTGGSNANLVAMFSARNRLFPSSKTDGMFGLPRLTAFVSDQAHYSFEHNANLMGLGRSSVYKVKSDANGRMIPAELEQQIALSEAKGEKPFFIAATASTTMLSAFDPIYEIVRIGKKNQIWVHVDGAFGGSLLLSSQGKQLFKGLEQSDSFAWDPHKLMNIPLIASVILVNNKQQLRQNLTALNDDYLYHENDTADYDLGKKSLQCGRRVDALKLWLAWKFYGDAGYRSRMDNLLNVADYFAKRIDSDPHFEAIVVRQTTTVCFRYLPQQPHDVDTLNEQIREALRKQGNSMVNYGYLGKRFAFRWVVANNEATTADVDRFFENFMHIATQLDQ